MGSNDIPFRQANFFLFFIMVVQALGKTTQPLKLVYLLNKRKYEQKKILINDLKDNVEVPSEELIRKPYVLPQDYTKIIEDVTKMKLEEWKGQYLLPSIKDNGASDLETRFNSRRELLKEGCHKLETNHDFLGHNWTWQAVPDVIRNETTKLSLMQIHYHGHYGICTIPKVGSTSWREFSKSLLKQNFKANHRANIIQIRHPLDRLTSTYTDKFLGGEPIAAYTEQYRHDIDSGKNWATRWYSYWLPALISTGKLQATEQFQNSVKKLINENTFYKKINAISTKAYTLDIKSVMNKFSNVSFTFEEFLRHVLWTKDLGLGDAHWIPQTELCNVCAGDFEYILKLENINEEIPYVLKTLNYPKIPVLKHKHSSKQNVKKYSYMDFYKDIPLDLLRKILELYKFDFILFGYIS
ncbi:unnamed protein product, partial [Meganyctiphanes norvegica]